MKNILRLEEFCMFALSAYAVYWLGSAWWFYVLLLLGPDISMIGYLAGNKVGAICYNVIHHKGIAVLLFLVGFLMNNILLQQSGIILFGHSSMDRMFGYGLKYKEGFQFTHMGKIGKKE